MRAYHRQTWLSASRALHLVQLIRLHKSDSPANMLISDPDHTETEERRRVFWMAYVLDHLFSMWNDWPVMLNEHVVSWAPFSVIAILVSLRRRHAVPGEISQLSLIQICTRLPPPEVEFQSGQPVVGTFLSEPSSRPAHRSRRHSMNVSSWRQSAAESCSMDSSTIYAVRTEIWSRTGLNSTTG